MAPRLRSPFKRNLRECEEVRDLMSDYVDGDLAEEDRHRVQRHVRFCGPCGRVLANLCRTLARLSRLSESPPPEVDDEQEVAERLRSSWRERV
jgi:anti-sigma factor RsiW